jgi:MFS family permease
MPATVWVLGFVSLLMDLSSEIYHALLPLFMTVTLGLPVAAVGAIDGVAEATASMTKLVSGRLSDRSRRRKPLILLGYGLAAGSKLLFPIANGALPVLGARFADRIGKGIRGAPRDAMIADETPPEIRGRAFGLRQSLDTVGAFLGPGAAIALMWWFANDIRAVFWVAVIPALLSFLFAWIALRETRQHLPETTPAPRWSAAWRLGAGYWWLIALACIFTLARFSESFLILRAAVQGLPMALAPLVLVAMNLAYGLLAYPSGAWADRLPAAHLMLAGVFTLIAADVALAFSTGIAMTFAGILLWGGHMALTQGLLSRLVAARAPADLRATAFGIFYFASGIALLLSSLGAGLIWDHAGPAATFLAGAGFAALTAVALLIAPKRFNLPR